MSRSSILFCISTICLLSLFACSSYDGEKEAVAARLVDNTPSEAKRSFPVYDSFAEIAPIFQQQTDTTYVINFWATWCKPCVKELPYFEALHDQFKGEKLKVILVSLDFKKDIEPKLIPFVEEHKLRSNVMALTDHKYNEWIDKVDPEWGGAIPVTVVYNSEKREFVGESFADQDQLFELVKELL